MKVRVWFWYREKGTAKGRNIPRSGYLYNPYLDNARECMETCNLIDGNTLELRDVRYWFEGKDSR